MTLVPLSQRNDLRPLDGAYDVRGWTVVTADDDARVGTVHDLLLDSDHCPRYLDVDLGIFHKHVLVPIGQARAMIRERVIALDGLSRTRLEAIPAWDHRLQHLTRDYETGLASAYVRAYAGTHYRPRPPYAGAVYGPSELESPVRIKRQPSLAPLSALPDYRLAAAEADPRGWTLRLARGEAVGRIEELVVDTRVLKVRFLAARTDDGHRLLIPAEYATLDETNRAIHVDVHSREALRELPRWNDGTPLDALSDAGDAPRPPGFYDHPRFSRRTFRGN